MTNQPTLYWNGSVLNEEDYSEIAQKFRISYDLVKEAVAQIRAKGEPLYAQYAGTARERIRAMAAEISLTNDPDDEEFVPVPDSAPSLPPPEPVETSDPAPATELQCVVSDAAVSLIQAMADTGEGHFIIEPDGCCSVNPENPPEITHAYQVVANVLKLRELAPAVDDKSAWMLGSVVASLEDFFGEDFSVSQVCDLETQSYNTIAQKVGVYKRFKNKRYNLPYSHHQEAHYAKIRDDDKANRAAQELILSKAESYELSAKQIRSLCSIAKKMDDETVIKNIRSKDQAMDLITAYNNNKVPYLVYDDGVWTRVSGTFDKVPEGKVVLDIKNWIAYAGGEKADILKASK